MEIVIFSGIQAAGKTTFFEQGFKPSHSHLSLDILKTRKKEDEALREMVSSKVKIVVDNTNPTQESRARYIELGISAGYRIIGYQFRITSALAIKRNAKRANRVPDVAIWTTAKRMVALSYEEGFNEIHIVDVGNDFTFRTMLLAVSR